MFMGALGQQHCTCEFSHKVGQHVSYVSHLLCILKQHLMTRHLTITTQSILRMQAGAPTTFVGYANLILVE